MVSPIKCTFGECLLGREVKKGGKRKKRIIYFMGSDQGRKRKTVGGSQIQIGEKGGFSWGGTLFFPGHLWPSSSLRGKIYQVGEKYRYPIFWGRIPGTYGKKQEFLRFLS